MLGNFARFLPSADIPQNNVFVFSFLKKNKKLHFQCQTVSDVAWRFVEPDLGPNCKQRLTADDILADKE